jgi:TonB family protein
MPPTVKENEILAARLETAQRRAPTTTSPGDAAIKQQPVALEVPVTVNGARALEGSDKREPFAESTKTVLIFGNGAVIRLSSSVAPGQLLFLTNERTKKEVVCQVVKSKNYRSVSGYVELEFTEPVVGFWGMRFPGDRIGSGPQPGAPVSAALSASPASGSPAVPRPVAPRIEAPAVSASVIAPKPAAPVSVVKDAQPKVAEVSKLEDLLPQKPIAPVAPLSSTLSSSFDPEAPLKLPSAPPTPPVVPALPVAPMNTIPEVAVIPAAVEPVESGPVTFDSPRASEAQASFLEPAKTPGTETTPILNLLSLFEGKPADPADVHGPAVQVFADPETETLKQTLKQHTARLEQELSNMMFSGEPDVAETVSVKIPHVAAVEIKKDLAENAAKILEAAHISKQEAGAAKPVEPVKLHPLPTKSLLQDEELKIPSWLEPLARNAAAPSSTQELIEREKSKRLAEQQPKAEEITAETATVAEGLHIPELPLPKFGDSLPLDEEKSTRQSGSRSSRHGMQIAVFAAVVLVLVVGAWWYITQPSGGTHASVEPATSAQASVISSPVESSHAQPQVNAPVPANTSAQANPAALTSAPVQSNAASKTPSVVPAAVSTVIPRSPQPSSNPVKSGAAAATSAPAVEAAEQPKKPVLGNVHLATPKVTSKRNAQNGGEVDAGLVLNNEDQPESSAEALNAGLVGDGKQPSAPATPLAVGGDVKQAKLIFSVSPVYPTLAKNQHVSGSVMVDALIDASGRVTTMKVVSGPTLLQQAAMDALKQWKYQPASLDGKPVAMHLTVTIQFRLP